MAEKTRKTKPKVAKAKPKVAKPKTKAKPKATKAKIAAKPKTKAKPKATKAKPKRDEPIDDMGIVIVDDDITIDKDRVNEERRAYLEEARSQEAFD